MTVIAHRRIGAVVYEGHVRARTLPDDPALDDLRTDWGEIEYVPAEQLRGAVEALRDVRKIAADTGRDGDQACGEIVARVTLALDAIGGSSVSRR